MIAGMVGLELTVFWLTASSLYLLSFIPKWAVSLASNCQKEGLTTVLQFYENMKNKVDQLGLEPRIPACKAGVIANLTKGPFSRERETRTLDLLLPKQAS